MKRFFSNSYYLLMAVILVPVYLIGRVIGDICRMAFKGFMDGWIPE